MTSKQCIGILILACFLCLTAYGATEQVTCTVTVLDNNDNPVVGAEVAVYKIVWAYMEGQFRLSLLGQIQKTKPDGTLLASWVKCESDIGILAHKEGLAMDWEFMNNRQLKPSVTLRLYKPSVLAGKVLDENGKAINGACVRMCLTNDRSGGYSGIPFCFPEEWFSTKTNIEGKFTFNNIADDAVADFWVEAPGRASFWTFEKWDSQPGSQFSAGRNDIEIVMPPQARIKGRVVNNKGEGISGVRLLARADTGNANYFNPDLTISGEKGHFCYDGLSAQTYSLQVVAPEDKMAEWVGPDTKVVCKTGETVEDVIVTVNKGGIVELVVKDAATRQPLSNIWFSISQKANYGRHPGFGKYGRTNAEGHARIRMPIGPCRVSAGNDGHSFYQLNPAITVIQDKTSQLEILLDRDPSISGTVRDDQGRPLAGVFVDVMPSRNGTDLTDEQGHFEVSWSPRGSTQRHFLLAQQKKNNLAAIVEIQNESNSIDIVLEPAMTLTGKVTDPNGQIIPVARIQLGAKIANWYTTVGSETVTDESGRYELPAISPAPEGFEYRISVDAVGYGPLEYQRLDFINASKSRFEDKSFILRPANLSVSGIVVGANDMPIAGTVVHVSGPRGNSDQPQRMAITNAKGEFYIGRICEGPLRIQAGTSSGPEGVGFLNAEGGNKDMKVILGKTRVHTENVSLIRRKLPDLRTHLKTISLLGKKLPDLNTIDNSNEALLICFWDFAQRPSRHGVGQLADMKQAFAEKRIEVILIHTTQMNDDAKKWIEEKQLDCHVGYLPTESESIRQKWGVQSLPWLILTDAEHVITDEGFSVIALEEKLKTK